MIGANAFLEYQNAQFRNALSQIRTISRVAEATDEAGGWGVDGWIKVIHGLLDLQIRYAAFLTESTLSGPWWLKRFGSGTYEADYLQAASAAPYPRRFTVVRSFTRVGSTGDVIPDPLIEFDPEILPPGEVRFLVRLRDETEYPDAVSYLGANYVGTICVVPAGSDSLAASPLEEPQTFTVGL